MKTGKKKIIKRIFVLCLTVLFTATALPVHAEESAAPVVNHAGLGNQAIMLAGILTSQLPGPVSNIFTAYGLSVIADSLESTENTSDETQNLEATEEDFNELENMLSKINMLVGFPFDVFTASSAEMTELILGDMLPLHFYYWGEEDVEYLSGEEAAKMGFFSEENIQDKYFIGSPKAYEVYPAEKVDWILENIFHMMPDHSLRIELQYEYEPNFVEMCYLDRKYYHRKAGIGSMPFEMSILSADRQEDGSYQICGENVSPYTSDFASPQYRYHCALELIDGERRWTFYSAEILSE